MPGSWHCDKINCPLKGAQSGEFRFCGEGNDRFNTVWVSKHEASGCTAEPTSPDLDEDIRKPIEYQFDFDTGRPLAELAR